MTDDLRGAVMTLLFCAVCGLLFHFLLPEGSVARTAKILIGLVMLCAVCAPLFGVWQSLRGVGGEKRIFGRFGEPDTAFAVDLYEKEAERAVCGICEAIVKKHTDVRRKIAVDLHISEDGAIRIERVRITFDAPPEGREAIEDEIAGECGVIPEIRVEMINE